MFTTIENLRNSNADQSRVDKVEKWLMSKNPNWTRDAMFPIFAVGNSNPVEDIEWVYEQTQCHSSWVPMEEAVLKMVPRLPGVTYPTIQQHINAVVRELKDSKAKTITKYTELYNKAFVSVFGDTKTDMFNAVDKPVETAQPVATETSEQQLAEQSLVDSAVASITEAIRSRYTLPLDPEKAEELEALCEINSADLASFAYDLVNK
jgi:hypothetical protein